MGEPRSSAQNTGSITWQTQSPIAPSQTHSQNNRIVLDECPLVAQLRHHLLLAGLLHNLANLINRMRQRFLAEHVLAPLQRRHHRHRMGMVRRRHTYRGTNVNAATAPVAPPINSRLEILCRAIPNSPQISLIYLSQTVKYTYIARTSPNTTIVPSTST